MGGLEKGAMGPFFRVSPGRMNNHVVRPVFRLGRSRFSQCLLACGMLAALAAVLAGCSRDAEPPAAPKSRSVTVALLPGLPGALVPLAAAKGYFADQGLEVTLTPTATSVAAIDALDKGQADLTMTSETPFVLAVLDKKNVRLLATVYRSRNAISIVARRDRGISRAADLAGKRIGLVANTAPDYFTVRYLEFQGIESDRVARVLLPQEQIERALLDGNVDAVATWPPYSSRLIARLGAQAVVFNEPLTYQMRFGLLARPEFAAARPAVARKFILALGNALDFVRKYPEEAKHAIVEATKQDPALLGNAWEPDAYMFSLDQGLLGGLEDQARWALSERTTRAPLPNFLEFIDARPLRSARPDAVSILLP